MRHTLVFLALSLAAATPALGNDSTAELRTGGLALTRSDALAMDEEDLYVSAQEIRVRYRFVNDSGAAVTTRVAFPCPTSA